MWRIAANALLTRITADQFAHQIETALQDVPATHGNEFAPPLRHIANRPPSDNEILEKAALKLQISQLEALVDRLALQLADERQAHAATKALATRGRFGKSYRQSAGKPQVQRPSRSRPSAAFCFPGSAHPAVPAVLAILGRLPD